MPWKETCVMDEKTAFIAECLRGELPMTALCERYGISRDTGYRLLRRYREEGPGGLEPRAPSNGNASTESAVTARDQLCSDVLFKVRRPRRSWRLGSRFLLRPGKGAF